MTVSFPYQEVVGAWVIAVVGSDTPADATMFWPESRLYAIRSTGEHATTSLLTFPNGWHAGQVWTREVPKSVQAAGKRIAHRMTKAGL